MGHLCPSERCKTINSICHSNVIMKLVAIAHYSCLCWFIVQVSLPTNTFSSATELDCVSILIEMIQQMCLAVQDPNIKMEASGERRKRPTEQRCTHLPHVNITGHLRPFFLLSNKWAKPLAFRNDSSGPDTWKKKTKTLITYYIRFGIITFCLLNIQKTKSYV